MNEFRVAWEIDVEADSADEAARKALEIHRDPESTATVFQVYNLEDRKVDWNIDEERDARSALVDGGVTVDLSALDNPGGCRWPG